MPSRSQTDLRAIRAILDNCGAVRPPFLISGPPIWNSLELGSRAPETRAFVYCKGCRGISRVGRLAVEFRDRKFPDVPTVEYFVIDLLNNAGRIKLDLELFQAEMRKALKERRFSRCALAQMAREYGRPKVRELMEKILGPQVRFCSTRMTPELKMTR